MSFALKIWNPPPGQDYHVPFVSTFADMPTTQFATVAEAHQAALAFVQTYRDKGGQSGGGHNTEMDYYYARDEIQPDRIRFTRVVVSEC